MGIRANTKVNPESSIMIPSSVANHFGFEEKGGTDKQSPYINLKYFDGDYQCFSELDKADLKGFTDSIRKLSQMNWVELKKQAGKGKSKSGFAPTQIPREQLPQRSVLDKISEEINFLELRLSQKARMFGFRSGAAFFLVFFDKDHNIT